MIGSANLGPKPNPKQPGMGKENCTALEAKTDKSPTERIRGLSIQDEGLGFMAS